MLICVEKTAAKLINYCKKRKKNMKFYAKKHVFPYYSKGSFAHSFCTFCTLIIRHLHTICSYFLQIENCILSEKSKILAEYCKCYSSKHLTFATGNNSTRHNPMSQQPIYSYA